MPERKRLPFKTVPARNGKRDAEIINFFQQTIKGYQRDGIFPKKDQAYKPSHSPYIGKRAATIKAASLFAIKF